MGKRRLFWRIYPFYLLISIFSLGIGTWYAVKIFRDFYIQRTAYDLEDRAQLISNQFYYSGQIENNNKTDSLCKLLGKISPTRITVILPNGRVLGDSKSNPDSMENHSNRPEIISTLLTGKVGVATRFSNTLKENMMYVAIPIKDGNNISVILRSSLSLSSVEEGLKSIYEKVFGIAILTIILAALASYFLSRRITKPIVDIKSVAEHFAMGDLKSKVPLSNVYEIEILAQAMNKMALQLDERINLIEQQKNTKEAIFYNMTEGVIAVDNDEKIIDLNKSACEMLELDESNIKGRKVHEAIRNRNIQKFIERMLKSEGFFEEEIYIMMSDGKERYFYARGTSIFDIKKKEIGGLIVMNDITRLKKLESLRRDFVANVSHELRTPITSIKGYAETLLSEAKSVPFFQDFKHFLEIILKQSDRLNFLIDDLMTLSKIEETEEKKKLILEDYPIANVIESAVEICNEKGKINNVKIEYSCDNNVFARINSLLLEQAVVNLIDNAIKFSSANGKVFINCITNNSEVIISVRDWGIGIALEHIPRLFERFYRVDKARSRKMGGTGLGLAIVKHIVQTHGGRVRVESELGKGSTFSIHLNK